MKPRKAMRAALIKLSGLNPEGLSGYNTLMVGQAERILKESLREANEMRRVRSAQMGEQTVPMGPGKRMSHFDWCTVCNPDAKTSNYENPQSR